MADSKGIEIRHKIARILLRNIIYKQPKNKFQAWIFCLGKLNRIVKKGIASIFGNGE